MPAKYRLEVPTQSYAWHIKYDTIEGENLKSVRKADSGGGINNTAGVQNRKYKKKCDSNITLVVVLRALIWRRIHSFETYYLFYIL